MRPTVEARVEIEPLSERTTEQPPSVTARPLRSAGTPRVKKRRPIKIDAADTATPLGRLRP
jgi:hypothetical protein